MKEGVHWPSLDNVIEMAATRVKQNPVSMARGVAEPEMRMFDWEHDGLTVGPSARVRGLNPLMSPCAVSQSWRYLTPFTASESYIATRCEVSCDLALGNIWAHQMQPVRIGVFL